MSTEDLKRLGMVAGIMKDLQGIRDAPASDPEAERSPLDELMEAARGEKPSDKGALAEG